MLDIINHTPDLLQAAASQDITDFLGTGIGAFIKLMLSTAGFLILLFGIFKAIKDVLGGKIGGAVKSILGAAVIAAFLIFPAETLGGLIDATRSVIETITGSVSGGVDGEYDPGV